MLHLTCVCRRVFPKIGVPQNGRFLVENPIKMDDLGGTTIFGNIQMLIVQKIMVFFSSTREANIFLYQSTLKDDSPFPQLRYVSSEDGNNSSLFFLAPFG